MKVVQTSIPDLLVIEPKVFRDDRGFFLESWNAQSFQESGLDLVFVQDNHSCSAKGVLRGLHFQNPHAQGKLVRVIAGRAWDVSVDLRTSSPTFGQWVGYELSSANNRMMWVPPGFAHGFLALEDGTEILYKCTEFYQSEYEHSLRWDDPRLAIDWPLSGMTPLLSEKDRHGCTLSEIEAFA